MRFNFSVPSIFSESLSWYEAVCALAKMVSDALTKVNETLARANTAVEKAEEIIETTASITYDSANRSIVITGFGE